MIIGLWWMLAQNPKHRMKLPAANKNMTMPTQADKWHTSKEPLRTEKAQYISSSGVILSANDASKWSRIKEPFAIMRNPKLTLLFPVDRCTHPNSAESFVKSGLEIIRWNDEPTNSTSSLQTIYYEAETEKISKPYQYCLFFLHMVPWTIQ